MMIERILKIIMSGGLAILTALIAYANSHPFAKRSGKARSVRNPV